MRVWAGVAVIAAAGVIGATACSDFTKWNQPPAYVPPPPPDTTPLAVLHIVAQKLRSPLYVTAPPGDTTRVFIVQQFGHIRVMVNDRLLGPDFLTLTGLIDSSGGERGVLSMAFDPNYATNGRFYVDYTDTLGNIQVVRYNVSGNPNVADKTTATPVLSIDHHLHTNHNGGLLLFGPDGYLYVGVGDGGGTGNPLHSGQDSTVLLAKILRIDVTNLPYTIPPSNPFASRPPAAPEVWDYGLRNPWRFSFDRLTHDFYIGDVGQDSVEEVDREAAGDPGGHNYGWAVMEGDRCYPPGTTCSSAGLTLPILTYLHGPAEMFGCSIIGGYVYRGTLAPKLYGRYVYADLCTGIISTFIWNGAVTDRQDFGPFTAPNIHITSFGEDARGEMYLTISNGIVYRFQSTN